MPLCMILVLPMFLIKHHYFKLFFFPLFCFQILQLSSFAAVCSCSSHPLAAPRSAEPADVFSWDGFQWPSTSPSLRRRAPIVHWHGGQQPPAARASGALARQEQRIPTEPFGIVTFAQLKRNNRCKACALARSSAVKRSKAKPTYNWLLWRSLRARSAWQRNSSYGSAGKLLYCNCTLYK